MITLFILIYLVLECIGDYFILYLLYCVIDWRSSHVYVHNIVAKKKKKNIRYIQIMQPLFQPHIDCSSTFSTSPRRAGDMNW